MTNTEKIIREYIKGVIHLSLATARDNKPWVCELHYAYDDNLNLYFRSLRSRRHSQEIAKNPNVAGNIIKQHSLKDIPLGVYFEGLATELKPGVEQIKAYKAIKARLKTKDEILEEANQPDGHQFYKIKVNNFYVFGIFKERGEKLKLAWRK